MLRAFFERTVFQMNELWTQAKDNVSFLLVSAAIVAALVLLAKLAERFLPDRHKVSPARRVSIIGICAAIATVLHLLDFPLLFLAPGFYKLDFSELPVMLCGFYLGPSATVICEAIKVVLKLLLKGTTTAFVGDFANFVVGCSLVLPASILYHIRKSRKTAIWGLTVGTLVLTVFGSAFNGIYLLPKFAQMLMPLEAILEASAKVNSAITSIPTLVFYAVVPLNLIKGISVSLLTMLLYKRVARPLFSR